MYPEKEILLLLAESALHPGAGDSIGHIDNPIQRERPTGNPIMQANGVKGALREYFEEEPGKDQKKIEAVFGTASGDDGSGAVSFGEARLLFFPVRSLSGVFAYITCPSVIARLQRDLAACSKDLLKTNGLDPQIWHPYVARDTYITHSDSSVEIDCENKKILVLEELPFKRCNDDNIDDYLDCLATSIFPSTPEYKTFKDYFAKKTVVINDVDYAHFVKFSVEVEPHNRIDDKKGTVDTKTGVWYTEYLPSESILYATLFIGRPRIQNGAFKNNDVAEVKEFIEKLEGKRTWLGGDQTTGKGRVMMHLWGKKHYNDKKEE